MSDLEDVEKFNGALMSLVAIGGMDNYLMRYSQTPFVVESTLKLRLSKCIEIKKGYYESINKMFVEFFLPHIPNAYTI